MRVRGPDGLVHEFPDGTTADQISAAFSESSASSAPPLALTPQANPLMSALTDVRGRTADALPSVGGFGGGLAGTAFGPGGRIAGAAIGGAAGEAGKELLMGDFLHPDWIAGQGALQGTLQGTGEAIAGAAGRIAPGLMKRAIGSVGALTTRFNKTPEEFAALLMGNRVAPNQAGLMTADAMNIAARAGRSQIISGTRGTVGAGTLARNVIRDTELQLGRGLSSQERAAVIAKVQGAADEILTARSHGVVPKANPGIPAQPASSILDEFGRPAIPATEAMPGTPSRYSARELEQIKEVAAKAARGQYKAEGSALSVAADPSMAEQIAGGARRKLAQISGVPEANAKIKDTMMQKLVVENALRKSAGEWTPIHIGPFSVGAKVPRDRLGQLALLLGDKGLQAWMRQYPRLAVELLNQTAYSSAPADATSGR